MRQSAELDGYIATTLRVDDSVDEGVGASEIVVVQIGAPALTINGPALVQDETGPILKPGKQYLLFLRSAGATTDGKYQAPFGTGGVGNIYIVAGGQLRLPGTADGLDAELNGSQLLDATSRISAAVAGGARRAAP